MLAQVAPVVALACGAFAIVVIATAGWHAWRRWRRVRLTQQAAVALLDVHQERLEAAIDLANERIGVNADGGDALAESLAELRADARHLRWMLGKVPDASERLQRELFDLILPTPPADRADRNDRDD